MEDLKVVSNNIKSDINDITEHKKEEEKFKQYYQFMLESAHGAIFFKNLQSQFIIANNKTLEVFGLSREQVIGKNDYEISSDKKQARKNIEDDQFIFKTGKPRE
ncbi:MAG: PAS domain S-box protein, partial [Candidatus Omnitrophica bacterium]|nr:PAS domain S-box protein [Candidatus Omnitrophota bacterium]